MGEPNIAELAVAAWRLERRLDNLNAENIRMLSLIY